MSATDIYIGWHRPDCGGRTWVSQAESSDLLDCWSRLLRKASELPEGIMIVLPRGQNPDAETVARASRPAQPLVPVSRGPNYGTAPRWAGWTRKTPGQPWKRVCVAATAGLAWLKVLALTRRATGDLVVVTAGADPGTAPELVRYLRGQRMQIIPQAAAAAADEEE